MVAAAASAAVMSTTASTTAAVKAAASATTVTTTTTLRKCSRRAKQRHCSDCGEKKLQTSGPVHGCYLHPTASQAVRAAGTQKPFYTN
jgi:hypothetical protein